MKFLEVPVRNDFEVFPIGLSDIEVYSKLMEFSASVGACKVLSLVHME